MKGNQSVRPFVSVLLLMRCPSHIARFVVAVIVNAVNLMIRRWSMSDVIKESDKRLSPRFTYGYAATAVALVGVAFWIMAPLDHVRPNEILRSATSSVVSLYPQTPATFRMAAFQRCPCYGRFFSALASAFPVNSLVPAAVISNNNEPSKDSPSKVLKIVRPTNTNGFNHDVSFLRKDTYGQSRRSVSALRRLALFYALLCVEQA